MKYLSILILLLSLQLFSITLKEVYDQAPSQGNFDKYIELETGQIYTGGLLMGKFFNPWSREFEGDELNVKIVGNGAIVDLQGQEICIKYVDNRLEVEDIILVNGGVKFHGAGIEDERVRPEGYVKYATIYKPMDYGIRFFGAGGEIAIENNIIQDVYGTGDDFLEFHGMMMYWLPTGNMVVGSIFTSWNGTPTIRSNWTYFSDGTTDLIDHYAQFCDEG